MTEEQAAQIIELLAGISNKLGVISFAVVLLLLITFFITFFKD